eukprot:GHRR01010167.1.p1 GENE.GHRR01010167.1~~GHRR01010167.1.p1  ORF type:complete len:315 (+),score=124.70 GHRR01010167.1:826-1770(+)
MRQHICCCWLLTPFEAEGRLEDLQALLASDAVKSLKVVDSEGRHVLNLALKNKHHAVVQMLLRLDPELAILPDMSATTPLHLACEQGNKTLAQYLLQTKTDINMQNMNMCAYSTGNWVVGDEAIMPVDKTPLHLAVEAEEVDIVKMLLAKGANPNLADYDGATPLHLALEQQDEEMVVNLLDHGANPDMSSKDVTSPLHALAQRGPVQLMQLLLQHKAHVHTVDGKGWTPLHLAARAGNVQKVQLLLQAGAKHGVTNSQGNTPLHLASVNGHVKVVEALLAAGADASVQNSEDKTAIDMSKTPEVKAALIQKQS